MPGRPLSPVKLFASPFVGAPPAPPAADVLEAAFDPAVPFAAVYVVPAAVSVVSAPLVAEPPPPPTVYVNVLVARVPSPVMTFCSQAPAPPPPPAPEFDAAPVPVPPPPPPPTRVMIADCVA